MSATLDRFAGPYCMLYLHRSETKRVGSDMVHGYSTHATPLHTRSRWVATAKSSRFTSKSRGLALLAHQTRRTVACDPQVTMQGSEEGELE